MKRTQLARRGLKWPETKELDQMLRRLVMARDDFACRRCGKRSEPGRGGAIETAHIYPKGAYPAMRYRLDNVLALCHRCHHHFAHKDPINFALWVRAELGPAVMDRLAIVAKAQKAKADRKADRLYLEAMSEKMGVLQLTATAKPARVVAARKPKRRNTR